MTYILVENWSSLLQFYLPSLFIFFILVPSEILNRIYHQSGLHLLGATNSLFGSIFAPLLPQSSWLYNPLYHTQQYILEPEWHALALRMAQQRLQRPDQARLEDLRKLRGSSASPEDVSKDKEEASRDLDSPDGSIEVDDSEEPKPKIERRSQSEESLEQDSSPRTSPIRWLY